MNARFWIRHGVDNWVKLTLAPNQDVEFYERHPTEEGWSSLWQRYYNDGNGVSYEWGSDGVDCDGRLEQGGESFCQFSDLMSRDMNMLDPCPENEGIYAPQWQSVDSHQRDYQAEAAGY
jgi:hypothetical protein